MEDGRLRLRGRWDGVFLRVAPAARARRLELRLAGRGRGPALRRRAHVLDAGHALDDVPGVGPFRAPPPVHYPESGGADLTVTVGTGGGDIALESLALVSPGRARQGVRDLGSP